MSYENLDAKDKEICEAIEASPEETNEVLAEKLGVEAEKVQSLRATVEENASKGVGDATQGNPQE